MASTKFYLDIRRPRLDGTCPITLSINNLHRSSRFPLGVCILPSQWDNVQGRIIRHPEKNSLNALISQRKNAADLLLLQLRNEGKLSRMTPAEIKRLVLGEADEIKSRDLFAARFKAFADAHAPSTRALYLHTLKRLGDFCPGLARLTFEKIDKRWLVDFEAYLAKTASKNARNIHLRNIRAVFNAAIDDGITTAYPFRQFKIRPTPTRKRSLTIDDLRRLFAAEVEPWQRVYLDMFKLIFFLVGINVVDLHRLKSVSSEGRVDFQRAKTHRLYSLKVEPEAMEIINQYRGGSGLLCIADRWADHRNFRHQMNKALQSIGEVSRSGLGGKKTITPMFPGLTTYWARHSWATVAASLDIPKETIAHALGHGSNTVTDIYIDFDMRKVDEANRRVIDWVLYGQK